MSIKTHRIDEIKFKEESFNLYNEVIENWLYDNGYYSRLDDDGCGIMEINIENLKKLIKDLEKIDAENYRFEIDNIKKDIEFEEKRGNTCILYYCF